jgi:thymidylate synthase (FAD)
MDDRFFRVATLAATPLPQQLCWLAMHQDYSEDWVGAIPPAERPEEEEAGRIVVKHLLDGERGHYGPLEHPQISLAVGGFPHTVMQQARTHRVAISFDVQSMRYTGQRVVDVASGRRTIEEVFYLRPQGEYRDRQGKRYLYTGSDRDRDLKRCYRMAEAYAQALRDGVAEEHARGMLPMDTRQDFVVSFNLRSAMHFLDLRAKADAQPEIQQLAHLMLDHVRTWAPQVMDWYVSRRLHRGRLAP